MTEADLQTVDELVEGVGRGPEATIPILQAIQGRFGWLPPEALQRVCERTEITAAQIAGVSTFYMQFRHRPVGRHVISVCHGTACHVKGAESIHQALDRHLGLAGGEDTDADGLFTVQKVACLGCCTLAPVLQIDGVTYGHLTADMIPRVLRDFLAHQEAPPAKAARAAAGDAHGEIRLGLGSCCVARGSGKVQQALEQALAETGVRAAIKRVGCVGMCFQTPLVEVVQPGRPSALYARVQPHDAKDIVRRHFKAAGAARRVGGAVSRLLEKLLTDESWEPVTRYSIDVRDPTVQTFLGPQRNIATEHCGRLDPVDIDEYMQGEGFAALKRCLTEMTPEQVIERVSASGLRGRGGAGYLTGVKWLRVRAAAGEVKYVVCNGDEGDPGAFMDRMIMESYPHRILEGIIIAAYAVGAGEGRLYIRAEYPLALRRVREAIRQCEQRGLLGPDILGTGFGLHLRIMEGAGAFVCGEETALLASIEGRRGMPRFRPPYPAERGLWGAPTLVNNVETYSLVPWIIRHGPEEFAKMGTAHSKGTKVFALAGKVLRGGLIEVPMGITLRRIVEDIGGGVAGGRRFKAVQVGGPSGGCLPAEMADIPVDYEALAQAGAIMGSGGLVVLDDSDCMVEIARYFLEFTQDQSCGRCTFCRIGTRRMLEILTRLTTGEGRKGDLERLEQLGAMVKAGSLCGLGSTAPNPVLTTLKYFRDEYEAHLDGRCPAGRCKALVTYSITDDCIGCTICAQHCPSEAIEFRPFEKHQIDPDKCIRCDTCRQLCPSDAIKVE
ncbi:MAG TPA: NAD(P)H-dependent oxidoreductase subunit E [Phycisphaerae bacterium]|nr:NAD(P)H-dependent oxidoreductase subunit E [Phycisphaerae bacterium]